MPTMELRAYFDILRRRGWIPLLLAGLTLALTLAVQRPWQPQPPSYALGLSFSVGVQPTGPAEAYDYDGYYTALASEYLIDDFAEIVKGSEFAAVVSARLAAQGISVPPGAIQGSTQTGILHRILQITIYSGDPAQLNAMADAVTATLSADAHLFMPRLLAGQGAVYLINRGEAVALGPDWRQRLDLPLRTLLALLAGLALAFLLEYLDDSIRTRDQMQALGLAVLGEIPRK